jgi:tRNA pseudouridine38-40 synthase
MRRLRLGVAYDGTDLCGWQRQDNGPTVQAHIEDAVEQMTGVKTFVRGAGRTDAGVHALGQVAHFDTEAQIPLHGFLKGLNSNIPRQIAITSVVEAAADFDARFSARGKLYRYTIWNAPVRAPLIDRYAWHARRPLDLAPMREAAAAMVGKHDFSAFRAADCERKTTVRTVTRVDVQRQGDAVTVEVEADAFLKNMVRIIVGTLAYAGWAKLSPAEIAHILAAGDRTRAGQTAPALGLTLVRVDY